MALLALIAAGLLAVPPEKSQAQEPNFAWITDTNGITWREKIEPPVADPWPSKDWPYETRGYHLILRSDKSIAEVVVPEHARIHHIDVRGCINLTNLIIKPKFVPEPPEGIKRAWWNDGLFIYGGGFGLRNTTAPRTMINSIYLRGHRSNHHSYYGDSLRDWVLAIQWTELKPEPPRIEIRTHATANGKEVEIVWRDGKLQIADAVNGEYRDHLGSSPLRFPLAAAKDKQFFRIARIESPTTEELPTPQTLGGNR